MIEFNSYRKLQAKYIRYKVFCYKATLHVSISLSVLIFLIVHVEKDRSAIAVDM